MGRQHAKGLPQIATFTPLDYHGAAQNWAAAHDSRGLLYIGNGKGLLEYDGRSWRMHTLPNRSAVRAIAPDKHGRLYVGGQQVFGYMQANRRGDLQFVPLSDGLAKEVANFGGVPNIFVTDSGAIFHTLRHTYIYSKGRIEALTPSTGLFQLAFHIKEKFYVNEASVGLQHLENRQLRLVQGGAFFADKRVELMLPFRDDTLLVSTEQHGIFLWTPDGNIQQFKGIDLQYQLQNPVYCGIRLPSGAFALGTHQDGLLLLDSLGRAQQHINTSLGLSSNLIWGINTDQQGNLWLCLDNGIAKVNLYSPYTYLATQGSALSATLHGGQLFLGTSQGIFTYSEEAKPKKEAGEVPRQTFIPHTEEQAWQFLSTDDALLCSHIRGIMQLKPSFRMIWEGFSWCLAPLPDTPDAMIAGTDKEGLLLLEKKKGQWQYAHAIEGFDEPARYLAFGGPDTVWVSHALKGIYCLKLSADRRKVLASRLYQAIDGLPSNAFNFTFTVGGKPIFATEDGIYHYNPRADRFEPSRKQFPHIPQIRKLVADAQGNIWFSTTEEAGVLWPTSRGVYEANYLKKLKGIDIYSISPIDSASVFFGTPQGIVQYNIPKRKHEGSGVYIVPYNLLIRHVSFAANDSTLFGGAFQGTVPGLLSNEQTADYIHKIPHHLNSLRFTCATTWLEDPQWTQFKYYMQGVDERWTEWTSNPERIYANLQPGDYIFFVKAKNAYDTVSEEMMYRFSIAPPWHQTWWAYLLYAAALAVLIWVSLKLYTRNLERDKRRLELLVEERTEEISQQKEEIAQQNNVLALQKEELEALNEEKNHLIGMLAHDMRNPLHQIKGTVDIMRMKSPNMSEDDKRLTGMITGAVQHLNSMITKILDLEAIESKKSNVVLERIDVGNTLRVIADSFQDRAAEKDIKLALAIPDRDFIAMLDRNFSIQVFENLVSNAIKFSPYGKHIHLQVQEGAGNKIRAIVRDEGPGISPEDSKKLFGKFQKLSARPTGGEKSTGLGLSIVKRYVEAMGGQVWCESAPGEGAAFIVEFPRANMIQA